jgi:hypothetical protein
MRHARFARRTRIAATAAFVFAVAVAGWTGPAGAAVVLGSPQLPPESEPPDCEKVVTHYVGVDVHALFPNGIDFSNPRHFCFQNVLIMPGLGGNEFEFFDSTVEGVFDDGSGPQLVTLQGPVSINVLGKGGATTGTWQTEILSMDLSGDVGGIPVQIRVSPSQPSVGQTSVTDLGGGLFQIDSFFDVFTELSVAGGPFEPSIAGPGRMTLERVVPAGAILPTPDLPPEPDPPNCNRLVSQYAGQDLHALFPNGIDFSNPIHRCFQNVSVSTDPGTGDETESFDSIVEGIFDDGSGPQPVVLTGPVTTIVRGKGGATTGSWDTEILSMSLSGDVGGVSIEIRESPILPSPGRTSVAALGNGDFQVDSFFDVFTEISIDGGPFQPQTNPGGRITLERIRPTVELKSPGLPPEPDPPNCDRLVSQYVGVDLHALYPNGIDFSNPIHRCFKNVQRTIDPGTGDEIETSDTIVEGSYDDGSGPQPVVLTGPVTTVVRGKGGATTGSWDTEILSMDLSGDVGGVSIEIRESPGLPSPGETTVSALPNGRFEIDSFFDVFTEISIDGGPFQPQTNDAGRLELTPIRPTVELRNAGLPPERDPPNCGRLASQYVGGDLHALYPNGIDFSNPIHRCFKNSQVTTDPGTGDEIETTDSIVEGTFDDGSGPQPVTLTGPVTTIVRGKGGATTGSWDTEILSMDLSGDVGGVSIEIRESPSLPSPGETTVSALPNGHFEVDSFFDVFTELSVNGGPFQPQTNGAGRMDLEPIRPSVVLTDPSLPPEQDPPDCDDVVSRYEGIDVHALFPNGIDFSRPRHKCFTNVQVSTDPGTGDETETFDSVVTGIFDDGSGPQLVTLTGPVKTVVFGKGGATTGSWDTEILSMSLSGDLGGVSIEIRESPSLPSPGETVVTDLGGGDFQIDSFFDVFTELSVDGGPFQPQTNEAGRMDLKPARPSVVLPDPDLPPEANPLDCDQIVSAYAGQDVHALFPGGIDFSDPLHRCFENVQVTTDPGTGDETETFDSIVEGTFDIGAGPEPVVLSGPVTTIVLGKSGATTGSWDTEILSMSLSGDVGGIPIEIRESPSLSSPGETRIDDLGGGQFEIDSFFDVFIELSVAGGPFQPQTNEAARMDLKPLPEPSQLLMLMAAIPVLRWMAKRRGRS